MDTQRTTIRRVQALALGLLCAWGASALAQQQTGITPTEIVLGTVQDLSGPLAGYGKQARHGMEMAIGEINEQGGIHGRKLRLQVEDSGYDPKRAVLAAEKLVKQERIFAMVGQLGTAPNVATMPVLFDKEVINFMPLSAAREMYEPFHRLKFATLSTYYEQLMLNLVPLARAKGANKVCTVVQDDEFGQEVQRGAQDALKVWNMALSESTSFKRGATDFTSQVAKLRAAGCELVVLGTIIRETVGVVAEARKNGYTPVFLATSGAYSELVHKLGGKTVEGVYATMTAQIPYPDDAFQPVRHWASKYRTQFNEDPSAMSVFGYNAINTFAIAMRDAGPRPTTSKFIRSMETVRIPSDVFGNPPLKFTPSKRLGSNASRLSQIQDGRWKVVGDYKGL